MKKRILSIVLSTAIFLSSLCTISFCAYASDFTYSIINDNEICITKYVGNETDVKIPDTIDGYSVTKIGERSFRNTSAKNVVIPEGVTEIADYVFSNLHLKSIILPNSLEIIGDFAFASTDIEIVDLPCNLKSIGNQAFSNTKLKNIFIPYSVESIGKSAFIGDNFLSSINVDEKNQFYSSENNILYNKDKTQLIIYASANEAAELILPDTVKEICDHAFSKACIQNIILPNGLEIIDDYVFSSSAISEINIPDSVKTIGSYVFSSCLQLTTVYIGKELETIGKVPFNKCTKIKSISVSQDNDCFLSVDDVLFANEFTELICYPPKKSGAYYKVPDSVTTIKDSAFSHCYSLFSLDLNNVEICENYAINNSVLNELILPSKLSTAKDISIASTCSVTVLNPECNFSFSIHQSVNYNITIYGYENSTAQAYVENNKETNCNLTFVSLADYTEEFEYTILNDNTAEITKYSGNNESVIIPSRIDGYEVTSIGAYAFQGGLNITELIIPDTVTCIGEGAFASCTNLKELSIPCSAKLFRPKNLLTSPNNNKKYSFYNCTNIEKIIITKGNGTMINYTNSLSSPNPDNPISYYKSAPWQISKRICEIILEDGIENIGKFAFYNTNNIYEINIPSTVAIIENTAFQSCSSLHDIYVDNNNNVYSDIDGILYSKDKSVIYKYPEGKKYSQFNIPDEVDTVAAYAFHECKNLSKLYISAAVCEIEEYGIIDNADLSNINVSEENKCFSSENGILYSKDKKTLYYYPLGKTETNFSIPYGVETVAGYAFYDNEHLKNIQLPETLLYINDHAFYFCLGIEEIVIPKSVKYIGKSAFISCSSLKKITVCSYNCELGDAAFGTNSTLYACSGSTTNQKYEKQFVSIGHDYEETKIPATCSNVEIIVYVCSVCGDTYSAEGTHLAGHSYTVSVVEPTCTEQGYSVYTCLLCGHTYIGDYIEALNHNIVIDEEIPASCTTNGMTQGTHCSRCNEILVEQKEIIASGHSFDEGIVKVQSTCTKSGTKVFSCKNCDYSFTENIAAAGHSYDNGVIKTQATCTQNGIIAFTCSSCGHSYNKAIYAAGHKYTLKLTSATLTKAGYIVNSCSVCGNIESETTVARIETVTLSKTSLAYTGKNLTKPTVTVKDSNGNEISSSYYTVTYISRTTGKNVSNIKAIGQYKIIVTFKGNYSGTKELYFSVKPKKVKIKTPITRNKFVTAKWKKDNSVSGYQVLIAADSKFTKNKKIVTINKNSTDFYKFTKLKNGKKYYIKIRSYKTIKADGRTAKMYSDYSAVKSIKCK